MTYDATPDSAPETAVTRLQEQLNALRTRLNAELIGQSDTIDLVLIALLADGHVLLEGVPGLGKTLLVRALAACFSGDFKRIQFTPDLMPSDITGHVLFDMNESQFRVRRGPIFTHLLLADEINRAPAKTQSALLEAMQERQVTLEGSPAELPRPYMVLATQNPIEQEGTYPLPEAQLDRFLLKILMDFPSFDDEIAMTKLVTGGHSHEATILDPHAAPLGSADILNMQAAAAKITVDDEVVRYAVTIVRATRNTSSLARGAGSRACIALVRCARAHAFLHGRGFVTPDDVKSIAPAVLRHRVGLAVELEMEGVSSDQALSHLIDAVDAPRL